MATLLEKRGTFLIRCVKHGAEEMPLAFAGAGMKLIAGCSRKHPLLLNVF